MLSVQDSVFRLHMPKQLAIHAWWITLPSRSRSLLVTWPSGLPQETIWAVMFAVKCACHTMGCASRDSGDMATVLGLCWGVQGTAVGPVNPDPTHIYPEML